MGLALIAAGIVALIVGGILTKRFSSRGSGPMAEYFLREGRRNPVMARAAGVPKWVSLVVLAGWAAIIAGVVKLIAS